ncbi:hypothetical protein [Isosphaera pallida]|uniref:hypothetical protein n=1 Tax=Isosphaera pallida TaxID=128 RepID=UPI00031C2092|nr:hypothetical protein [Isosphaera pallida]
MKPTAVTGWEGDRLAGVAARMHHHYGTSRCQAGFSPLIVKSTNPLVPQRDFRQAAGAEL